MTIRTTIEGLWSAPPAAATMRRASGAGPLAVAVVLLVLACVPASEVRAAIDESATPAQIERVRYSADGSSTRVIVILSRQVPYEVSVLPGGPGHGSKARLVIDFSNARLGSGAARPIGVEDGLLQQIRTGQFTARTARVVLDLTSVTKHSVSELTDPPRVVIDIAGRPAPEGGAPTVARASGDNEAQGTAARGDEASAASASAAPSGNTAHAASPDAEDTTRERQRAGAGRESTGGAGRFGAKASTAPDELASAIHDAKPKADGGPVAAPEPATPRADGDNSDAERDRIATAERPSDKAARETKEPESRREPNEKRARGAEPSVIRRIVLDPGHGGNDPGAQGVDGVLEKDVTLAIAKKLKRRLEDGLHAEVVLTRTSDVTRTLAERTAFANARGADLFISIHTNADVAGRLHGIETYTLNNSNDRATIRLAKMENGPGFRTPRGSLSFILSDLVQSGKEEESNALAERLQYRMLSRLRNRYPDVRDLGVKRGPFYVLVGAYMPCVLVETSFLSHPVEGRRLATEDYQAEVVEGLYLGVADFFGDARLAKTL